MLGFKEIKHEVSLKVDKKEDQWALKQKWSIITVCMIQSNSYNMYDYTMLFINKNENSKLYKHFFKNIWYKVYNTDDTLIMEMIDDSSNSGTEVVKITHKLEWIKARENDQGLLPNSDVIKQKSKELRKLTQKKEKPKESGKVIQFIEENNDARAKLIEELKEEACRAIKEIIAAKGTDGENKLNDDDDLKDSTSISKGSKNKLKFIKSAVLMWSSSCIQI